MNTELLVDNPLLARRGPIRFDEINADAVVPAIEHLIREAQDAVDAIGQIAGEYTYANTLQALEDATSQLEDSMGWVHHLEGLLDDPELRNAYNTVQPQVAAFYSAIPLNAPLWTALTEFAKTEAAAQLPPVQARLLQRTLDEFRRHGAELSETDKETLRHIDTQLAKETNTFAQNVVDATDAYELIVHDEARLAGLPDREKEAARRAARTRHIDGWRFSLQGPSFVAALTYLDDAELRETLYRAYNRRASEGEFDNSSRLQTILALRQDKATLLGYTNVSDLYLADRMVRRGHVARDFVTDLRDKCESAAQREHDALVRFAREHHGLTRPLQPWDLGYYAEKQRRAEFDFDEEALRPYFSMDGVLQGVFDLFTRLYGVTFRRDEERPTWHPDVRAYCVFDEAGRTLGVFYLDMHPREGKRGGAWMRPFRTGDWDAGHPHEGTVCCNLTPPTEDGPALLRHREVETVFHEFGHLMHHLLTDVPVRSLAGTNVAWDFVELPSQIMENWCWEKESLALIGRHFETGECIPDVLFEKMRSARTFRAAGGMMRQLSLGTVDLSLHQAFDVSGTTSVVDYARRLFQDFQPDTLTLPDDYAMIASFQHLFSGPVAYASGYYSYLWAEVLEADAFSRFKDEGLFSRTVGNAFREQLLARGNSREPMELFVDFMGREPDPSALLKRAGLLS